VQSILGLSLRRLIEPQPKRAENDDFHAFFRASSVRLRPRLLLPSRLLRRQRADFGAASCHQIQI
jgi:hypothetical protein